MPKHWRHRRPQPATAIIGWTLAGVVAWIVSLYWVTWAIETLLPGN